MFARRDAAAAAVERVNDTLRGPVIDIFLEHVPGLRGLGREQAFELIMGNPKLVEECFKLFRRKPDLFEQVLVGPDGESVSDANQQLQCGRTLNEVVALIVRAVARRHFLERFRPVRAAKPEPPPPSLWQRMLRLLRKPPPPPRPRRQATRGDRLYQAMREFLLYEWQLPLIPHYTPLPVATVRTLGPRILEYRDTRQLKSLLLDGPPPEQPSAAGTGEPAEQPATAAKAARTAAGGSSGAVRRPAAVGGAQRAMASPAKAEAMWKVSQTIDLAKLFDIDESEMRRTIAHASGVSNTVVAALSSVGLKIREAVVVLCTVDRVIGHSRLSAFLGSGSDGRFVTMFIEYIRREGIPAMQDPKEIRTSVERILTHMKKVGHLS